MLNQILSTTLIMAEHGHGEGFWSEFSSLATDPAHILFELVFSLIFDVLIISFIYGVLIKKIIIPKLRRDIHKEIDTEHGYEGHKKLSDQ